MANTEEPNKEAHLFYKEALQLLNESGAKFMIGGGFALFHYTGMYRDTKDLDIFCKVRDYPKILKVFADKGYRTELTDVRWLAKIFKGDYFIDIIFDTPNVICAVDETWFKNAPRGQFADTSVLFVPAEELVWCKIYVQNRERYDGADINHLFLKHGEKLNWEHLLDRMDKHWQLLLAQILSFQFVYPSDHAEIIPQWLFDELLDRAREQSTIPSSLAHVCRGPMIDQVQYAIDIKEWDYKVCTMKSV